MAKDRDGEALGANQSKRPPAAFVDFGDQPQHPPQQHHRVKSQKHLVGGATGGHRLHARIPSSKALHKHHASTSTAKLNRSRHGSLSPDQEGTGQALASHHHHRRATSELKLTTRDPSSSNLKSAGQANLKRNHSQAEVHKRTKSATTLHRSASNPAVSKLRSSGSSSRVQFNLGDEGQGEDDQDEDEWVDASTSASPLLSRRSSAVSAGQLANHLADDEEHSPARSPGPYREDERPLRNGTQGGAANGTANGAQDGARSLPRNQYLTSRILSRTPSHGAPPMMSAATVSVRPSSSRQPSPPDSSLGQGPSVPNTPGPVAQVRPGSSGKAELTSRFVGVSSQEPGSGIPGESFILAANRGGLSRAALPGDGGVGTSKRRQSLGAMSQARGIDALNARQAAMAENNADDEDEDDGKTTRLPRQRQSGDYVVPREMNRTQQKLNLQRASSSLEPSHPHPGLGIGPAGVAAGPVLPLLGVPATYDSRDPRVGKMLERTGMEYLTVRRHLNPVARSIARVMQLPDLENSRRIPRPGTSHHNPQQQSQPQQQHHTHPRSHQQQQQHYQHHASRLSEQFNPVTTTTTTSSSSSSCAPVARESSMVDLIAGRRHTSSRRQQQQSIPRPGGRGRGGAPFSAALHSGSSSLGGSDDDDDDNHHDRDRDDRVGGGGVGGGGLGGLSGSSLVNGAEDAETMALLRMLWDKNLNLLSASQE